MKMRITGGFKILSSMFLLLFLASTSHALLVDFESAPNGGSLGDNIAFSGTYTDGATSVTFGIDTNNDLATFEESAFFELRGGDDTDNAYVSNTGSSHDYDTSGFGGSYFLRPSMSGSLARLDSGESFVIAYSGLLPTEASGGIWDIDGTETNRVYAYDSTFNLIGTSTLSSPPALDSAPSWFSFTGLSSGIAYIKITSGGPLGFDYFNATSGAIPDPVPEPATMLLLGTGLIGLAATRRRNKK